MKRVHVRLRCFAFAILVCFWYIVGVFFCCRSVSTAKYAVKWWWCFNRSSSALLLRRKLFNAFCFMSSLFVFLSSTLSLSPRSPPLCHSLSVSRSFLFLSREGITHTFSFSRRSRFQCGDGMFALKFTLSQTLLLFFRKKKQNTTTTICLWLFFSTSSLHRFRTKTAERKKWIKCEELFIEIEIRMSRHFLSICKQFTLVLFFRISKKSRLLFTEEHVPLFMLNKITREGTKCLAVSEK